MTDKITKRTSAREGESPFFRNFFAEKISLAKPISHTEGVFSRSAERIDITASCAYPYAQDAKEAGFLCAVKACRREVEPFSGLKKGRSYKMRRRNCEKCRNAKAAIK